MSDLDDGHHLRALMERSVPRQHPNPTELQRVARSAGRRVRRRRRAGVAATSLVTAVVASVVAAALSDRPGSGSEIASDPPAPEVRTGTARASFPASLGSVQVPARQVLRRLRPLLPQDAAITRAELTYADSAPGESGERAGSVRVDLDRADPGTRGGLEVILYAAPSRALAPDDPARLAATGCPPRGYTTTPSVCTVLTDDLGTPIGRALEYVDGGSIGRDVLVETDAGGWVYVGEANSLDEKWGGDYSFLPGDPPLTLTELEGVARSPRWDRPGSSGS